MIDNPWAWVAGFYEGEGYISQRNGGVQLGVASTDKDTLDTLASIAGGAVSGPRQRNHWKPQWTWNLAAFEHAQMFVIRIWPYLHERRRGQISQAFLRARAWPRKRNYRMIHGTTTMYTATKCRCDACVAAYRKYHREYHRAHVARKRSAVKC